MKVNHEQRSRVQYFRMGCGGDAPHRARDCRVFLELKWRALPRAPQSRGLAWYGLAAPGSSSESCQSGSVTITGIATASSVANRDCAPSPPIPRNEPRVLRRDPQPLSIATKQRRRPPSARSGWCYHVAHIRLFCSRSSYVHCVPRLPVEVNTRAQEPPSSSSSFGCQRLG